MSNIDRKKQIVGDDAKITTCIDQMHIEHCGNKLLDSSLVFDETNKKSLELFIKDTENRILNGSGAEEPRGFIEYGIEGDK